MINKEYAQSLRELADFLDGNPDFPSLLCNDMFNCFVDSQAQLQKHAKSLGAFKKHSDGHWLILERRFGSIRLHLNAAHEKVCERVVTGYEEVEVPDPEYIKAAPKVVERKEKVEWRCPESVLSTESNNV